MTSTGIVTEIAQAVAADKPDLLIFLGDQMKPPVLSALQQWTNTMAPVYQAGIGVYPIRGNHDANTNYDPGSTNWMTVYNYLPTNGPPGEVGFTYSVSNMNAVFIGLDENVNSNRVNQEWLNAQLASSTGQHVFVFGHMPAFPTGTQISNSLAN